MLASAFQSKLIEAGCDEAGRGCLAGPVFAAAVILPKNYTHSMLNDSKKISEKNRIILRKEIERDAIAWQVASSDNRFIDTHNILKSSILTMHKAIRLLNVSPEFIIIDGNYFLPYEKIPYRCIVKGDSKYLSIAAASILAKTYRDEYMVQLHDKHPEYNWLKNKGYPTADHRAAIQKYGITDYHRRSFQLGIGQLSFDF